MSLAKPLIKPLINSLIPRFAYHNPIKTNLRWQVAALQHGLVKNELVSVDGSNLVSSWKGYNETTGDVNQFTQVNKPIYIESGINGRPSLEFDGVNDFLEAADGSLLDLNGDCTFFFVAILDAISGSPRNLLSKGNSSYRIRVDIDRSPWMLVNDGGLVGLTGDSSSIPLGTPFVLTVRAIMGTRVDFYVDGVSVGSPALVKNSISSTSFKLTVGSWQSGNEAWSGDMGEQIVYDRALSDSEINKVNNNYLTPKWGISTSTI